MQTVDRVVFNKLMRASIMTYLRFNIRGNASQGFNLSHHEKIEVSEAQDLMTYCEDVSHIKDQITVEHFSTPEEYNICKSSKIFRDDTGCHFVIKPE